MYILYIQQFFVFGSRMVAQSDLQALGGGGGLGGALMDGAACHGWPKCIGAVRGEGTWAARSAALAANVSTSICLRVFFVFPC